MFFSELAGVQRFKQSKANGKIETDVNGCPVR
jgi:hypothetical protein